MNKTKTFLLAGLAVTAVIGLSACEDSAAKTQCSQAFESAMQSYGVASDSPKRSRPGFAERQEQAIEQCMALPETVRMDGAALQSKMSAILAKLN